MIRWSPLHPATSKKVKSLQRVAKKKQQNIVSRESKAKKYQLHIFRETLKFQPRIPQTIPYSGGVAPADALTKGSTKAK